MVYHTEWTGGRRRKGKEEDKPFFFTPLDPFGSDAHEQEKHSEYFSKPRKVHYQSHWRRDQNTETG